jgi:hypothetical protein
MRYLDDLPAVLLLDSINSRFLLRILISSVCPHALMRLNWICSLYFGFLSIFSRATRAAGTLAACSSTTSTLSQSRNVYTMKII